MSRLLPSLSVTVPFGSFPPVKSSEDEDFGASVADEDDDDDDDEDGGSDIGSVDSRAHARRLIRGACKRKAVRAQHKARKLQRGRRRCSSEEEEEEDSEEEMGECLLGAERRSRRSGR